MSTLSAAGGAVPRRPVFWWKRLVRWFVILLAAFVVVQFVLLPIGFALYATTGARGAVGPAPDGFETVALTTADGDRLAGWYAAPANGAAIVLLHGAGNTRDSVRGYAEMLVEHGFGVLALDLRGHGESEGQTNRFGWQGTDDVKTALTFLNEQSDVQAIGGLGLSVGGEVLLGAASENPALAAIVSEGATARSLAEFQALPPHRNPVSSLTPRVMYGMVRLLTGTPPPMPLLDSIRATQQTRFLLLAAEKVADEAPFNQVFADAAPGRAEVWNVADAGHTGAYSRYPQEYEQRVVEFFNATLLARE